MKRIIQGRNNKTRLNPDHAIKVVLKTTTLPSRPRGRVRLGNFLTLVVVLGVFIGVSGIEDASLIAMGILFALVVIWFVLENFVWQQYCRFNFTIYPVLIFDLAGVLARITSFEDNINLNRLIILVSVQMAFCCMAFLIRIALLVYKIRARANANS